MLRFIKAGTEEALATTRQFPHVQIQGQAGKLLLANKERRGESDMEQGRAIIIGAGPAGLTAALELVRRTGLKPVVLEASQEIGGLSRTVVYKGNRMDIGGHRFFSKSDRVMNWWLDLMPLEGARSDEGPLRYQGQRRDVPAGVAGPDPRTEDLVMLVRERKSRIYSLGRFFDYPIRLTGETLRKMGMARTLHAGMSYLRSAVLPQREERSLEDFLINRFGRQLYLTFFKSYTEKIWGVACDEISAEWGAQRIKGLSLRSMAGHFAKRALRIGKAGGAGQWNTETSLIERFLYPKLGPGQLWEHVAGLVRAGGGEIHMGMAVDRVHVAGGRVASVEAVNGAGERMRFAGEYFFSTMAVKDLIRAFGEAAPGEVSEVSEGLMYRDFIVVGLLAKRLAVEAEDGGLLKDNWIYVQDPHVKLGRLQIFNNWSPWLVASADKVWIGLEYFCNESDELWRLGDEEMAKLGTEEAARIGILRAEDVEDAHVVRVPKSYPAYFGSYSRFDVIRKYTDGVENLFLLGRNGMHRYNNQDHSMLTAMTAVDNLVEGIAGKENLWAINTEMEYHEETED